jgi:hypothetical protein
MDYQLLWVNILVMIVIIIQVVQTNDEEDYRSLCPDRCVCLDGMFLCQNGGLLHLPTELPRNTTRVVLWKHEFEDPILQRVNLTVFHPPKFHLAKLMIRECRIRRLEVGAFYELKYLRELDLSDNLITRIEALTFAGLNLEVLKLDGNRNLQLDRSSFDKLNVTTLLMVGCQLRTLDYATFRPILKSVVNLDVSHNELTSLDIQFDGFIRDLEQIELGLNPLECSCDTFWLSEVLLWRKQFRRYRPQLNDKSNLTKCASPPHLKDVLLYQVVSNQMLKCKKLALTSINIDLVTPNISRFSCQADGPPSTQIQWFTIEKNGLRRTMSPFNTTSEPYSSSVVVSPPFTAFQHLPSSASVYLCDIRDTLHNLSVVVRIHWSNAWTQHFIQRNSLPTLSPLNPLLPLKEANIADEDSYFLRKRFTLLELIFAVIGVFFGTLFLFLIIFKFICNNSDGLFSPTHSLTNSTKAYKHLPNPSHHNHHPFHQPLPSSPIPVYDEGAIYDIPTNVSTNPFPVVPTVYCTSPMSIQPQNQFIDYKTHRKI